jgi:hypothetical protein
MSMKNSMTPSGIEPATFRFVAQYHNHCDTVAPTANGIKKKSDELKNKYLPEKN